MGDGPRKTYRAAVASGALKPDAAQEAAAERLQALSERLRRYRPGRSLFGTAHAAPKGLYIYGDVGRGKSMLMDLFFASAPMRAKRRVHFHAFMLEIHDAINTWRKLDAKGKLREAKGLGLKARGSALDDPIPPVGARVARSAMLLCFDEFHVTDVADAMILGRLFEALFMQGVVIVATSNRAPGELYKNGINRQLFVPFIALIEQKLEVFGLAGPTDYRLERLKSVEVYHAPLDAMADRAMDTAWLGLTDMPKGQAETLSVQGRTLKVPQAAKGVARFSFEELCARPLGAADYLEIAQTYHTVLIDRIPKMGPERRNEAARFVTLIDALYEMKTKLICSADAQPTELYTGGDGSFEFHRTASRLIEMQSADYMALGHCAA